VSRSVSESVTKSVPTVSYPEPLSSSASPTVDMKAVARMMGKASPGLAAACCRGVWG
jgi:hypothetical protein